MTKKFCPLILLLFVILLYGCNKEIQKKPQTLIYDSNTPFTLYGSISLNQQIKTTDTTTLIRLQNLPLAGVFPVRSYLSKQVALSFDPMLTTPDSVQANTKPSHTNSHVIIDASGYFTTFTTPPKNVAVLFSSYAQVWQDVGGTVSITVGESVDRGLVKKEEVSLVGKGASKEIDDIL